MLLPQDWKKEWKETFEALNDLRDINLSELVSSIVDVYGGSTKETLRDNI